jgi:hypothetical protein
MAVINVQKPIVKRLSGGTVLAIKYIKKLAAEGRFWPNPTGRASITGCRCQNPLQTATCRKQPVAHENHEPRYLFRTKETIAIATAAFMKNTDI